ncbi:MAG TPA: hypothetical protein VHG90_10575, partial [Acidimicrobiales bacterium]|nr:hypothetical protein [Acidimicrobiales bacterium]
RVLVVPREGVRAEVVGPEVYDAMAITLAKVGALPASIHVEVVASLPRDAGPGSKFKLIESRAGARAPSSAAKVTRAGR